MRSFMDARGISKGLQKRISEFYRYKWSGAEQSEAKELFDDLHSTLKLELDMSLNVNMVASVPMFAQCSTTCLLALIEKL